MLVMRQRQRLRDGMLVLVLRRIRIIVLVLPSKQLVLVLAPQQWCGCDRGTEGGVTDGRQRDEGCGWVMRGLRVETIGEGVLGLLGGWTLKRANHLRSFMEV